MPGRVCSGIQSQLTGADDSNMLASAHPAPGYQR